MGMFLYNWHQWNYLYNPYLTTYGKYVDYFSQHTKQTPLINNCYLFHYNG